MSFILEALKKADAERDRGAVPDLHAQGLLPEAAFEGGSQAGARPWVWLVAGAAAALLAIAAWQRSTSDEPMSPAPPPVAIARPTAPPVPAAPASVAQARPPAQTDLQAHDASQAKAQAAADHAAHAPEGAAPAEPVAQRKPPAPKPAPAPRDDVARTDSKAATRAATKADAKADARVEAKAETKAEPKADAKPAPPRPAAPPVAEPVPLFSELPDDIRRQVPPLKLGGLVYSATPASRMLIVNGDVQREGSVVAPGLTLERIKQKSVVFSLRGQRFEMPL